MILFYHRIFKYLPTCRQGLAWDNFDINTETSEANTIHHTYRICYQNIMPSENSQFDVDIETKFFVNMQVERKFKKVPIESKQDSVTKKQNYLILSQLSLTISIFPRLQKVKNARLYLSIFI